MNTLNLLKMNQNLIFKTFISLSFLLINLTIFAQQNVEFTKDNFKNNKEGFKEAMKNLEEGDENYKQKSIGTYLIALGFYLKANQYNPNNALLNYKIGECYLNSITKIKAIDFFKKAFQLDNNVAPDIHYFLGRSYHLNYEFDKAIEEYNIYKKSLSPKDIEIYQKGITKLIAECNTGKELIKNPVRVFIDNLGDNINTKYPEYSPTISTDESMMLFTSRREGTTGGSIDPDDNQYLEDIYISYNINGKWQIAKNVGKPLNSKNNDATVALSPDGQQLFSFDGSNGGDILVSELKGTEWTSPDKLNKNINSDYHESSASFSYDGKTMYFVSDRPEGIGGRDIYMSKLDKKGKWDKAINMGNVINTEYDEEGVFMHPDGRTMYFCSQGHNTMGGYDIFKTVLQDDGKWSTPENLGYPINTPDNDVFFVINANGKHGYYSSAVEGGYGNYDIYVITFLGPEKPMIQGNEDNLLAMVVNPVKETVIEKTIEIKTTRLTILKGIIKDAVTLNPIEAQIEIIDNDKNEVVSVATSNSSTGKYLISLPSGKNYGIAVKAKDYLFHSENFDIPAATNYQEINKDILLNKLVVGTKIILKNIFFDYAKSTLRPSSFPELERVLKLMNDFPTIRVEISGHTDNQGSLGLNKKLSEARAKAVVDYLISKGISASRLEYQGYAYFQPVATNDTDEGRQENRRVEFKILSK